MEYLTRENFWNELQESFPEHIKLFYQWLEKYKKTRRWETMFLPGVQFMDLPLELQVGVVYLFFREAFDMHMLYVYDVTDSQELAQTIKDTFATQFMQDQFRQLDREQESV